MGFKKNARGGFQDFCEAPKKGGATPPRIFQEFWLRLTQALRPGGGEVAQILGSPPPRHFLKFGGGVFLKSWGGLAVKDSGNPASHQS